MLSPADRVAKRVSVCIGIRVAAEVAKKGFFAWIHGLFCCCFDLQILNNASSHDGGMLSLLAEHYLYRLSEAVRLPLAKVELILMYVDRDRIRIARLHTAIRDTSSLLGRTSQLGMYSPACAIT